jgi:hypothetical protein
MRRPVKTKETLPRERPDPIETVVVRTVPARHAAQKMKRDTHRQSCRLGGVEGIPTETIVPNEVTESGEAILLQPVLEERMPTTATMETVWRNERRRVDEIRRESVVAVRRRTIIHLVELVVVVAETDLQSHNNKMARQVIRRIIQMLCQARIQRTATRITKTTPLSTQQPTKTTATTTPKRSPATHRSEKFANIESKLELQHAKVTKHAAARVSFGFSTLSTWA